MGIQVFNAPAVVFGQVVDSFLSTGAMTVFDVGLKTQTQATIKGLAGFLQKNLNINGYFEDPERAYNTANFIVHRGISSIGNFANGLIQLVGGAQAEEGGARKVLMNGLYGKVVSTAIGSLLGFTLNESMTVPLSTALEKTIQSMNPGLDPETTKMLAYGYATEAVNAPISLASTLLSNTRFQGASR